jgi:hypothetical protein
MDTNSASPAATSGASAAPPPLTAHMTGAQSHSPPAPHVNHDEAHLSRSQVPWGPEVWASIDRAVLHEVHRTRKATKVMPQLRVGHHVTNVEQDVVLQTLGPGAVPFAPPRLPLAVGATPPTLNVYEGANLAVIEFSIKWALTHAQVKKESERHREMHAAAPAAAHHEHSDHHTHHHMHYPSSTAVMLARRAAMTLCLGMDAAAWLGANAFPVAGGAPGLPLFSSQTVIFNGVPADNGLTCVGGPNAPLEVLTVQPVNALPVPPANTPALYSTNTVAKISQAVTDLAANGYGGPYLAMLPPYVYAESFFPLNNTLQRPADLIIPLLAAGYHDSAVMPGVAAPVTPNPGGNPLNLPAAPGVVGGLVNPSAQGVGFVLSIGGSVVEFVNSLDPVTSFSQIDGNGNFIFQLKARAATKISDAGAIVRLEFV